jgi:hypothetical protein
MRGFDRTQTAVPIIKQICIDVYPYLFVLSTILVGCAFVFMHLLDIDNLSVDISRRYVSPVSSYSLRPCAGADNQYLGPILHTDRPRASRGRNAIAVSGFPLVVRNDAWVF